MENRIGAPSTSCCIFGAYFNTWLVPAVNSRNMALLEQDKDIIDSTIQGVLKSLPGIVQESLSQARSQLTALPGSSEASNQQNPLLLQWTLWHQLLDNTKVTHILRASGCRLLCWCHTTRRQAE